MATVAQIGDLAAAAGIRRVHILAWRDLDDVEAGGSELHADRVARLWAEAGIEVTMRTSFAPGFPPTASSRGYRVVRRGGRYMVFPRAVLAELSGLHGPSDALVEIWNGMPFLSPLWAHKRRAAWVHQPHTDLWDKVMPPGRAALGRTFERDLAPWLYRATPVVTLSESVRSQLLQRFRFVPERVHVVPPGIDSRFRPADDADARAEPLLVAVGRLTTAKAFNRVIRIVAGLRERVPARLVIVGAGAEGENLHRLVAQLGAEQWCELAGRVDDDALLALYQQAQALVSASVAEGWGMTITEAAACATPAVVSDIAGHRDAVVDGETGHLARRDEDFVDALERVVGDRQHRARLAEAARARAAGLTWERTALDTLAVLAGKPRSPAP